jgi:DNA-directed RNA polymerase subunit RPC12/RpoP
VVVEAVHQKNMGLAAQAALVYYIFTIKNGGLMAIRYEYKCDKCGRGYIEQREPDLGQVVLNCECGGAFQLSGETPLEAI